MNSKQTMPTRIEVRKRLAMLRGAPSRALSGIVRPLPGCALLCALAALAAGARAADAPPADAGASPGAAAPQVIQPEVERRDVQVTHIPSNDIELGLFTGTYNVENFGNHIVEGARLGYHITESVFIEAAYGQTKVSDSTFRLFLPGGIFPLESERLRYYNLSAGYNILPGEIFLPRNHAKVSAVYLIAGLGTTKFDDESHETINAGAGMRVFLADWAAVQLDVRDHFFSFDLLGTHQSSQNLEFTAGLTFFF
jgi:outer membrane beta-barrel protein